jgi:predicted RNA-binding Zn-ribbon protein involved in translation (DUF1610 family)
MSLSNEQKILYLSNVVAMARADGQLSPDEVEAIEAVTKSIGARKTELNKAYQQAEQSEFQPAPVGFWSDKIKNLEDIIYVSMIDGEIDNREEHLLLAFAKQVKISQEQLNLIIGDVKNAVSIASGNISCPSCKAKVTGPAKFCPACGAAIQESSESQSIAVSYDIPTTGITIEFAESTASGFAHAVRDHQKAPVNATCVKGKKTWYLSAWPTDSISQALKLVENLKGMRNRKVYVDGKESQWDDVFGFAWCANSRKSAYRPNEYCFGLDEKRLNVWGCKQARMEWTEWADWFGYGSFKQGGMLKSKVSFVFDKKRIRHELETNLYKCRFCPHLQFKLIEAVLDILPDEVTPSEKGPWVHKRDYNESRGSILVKIKTREGGYTYTDEYHSSGVIPSSINIGLELLRKAFKVYGYPASEIKGVLEYKG